MIVYVEANFVLELALRQEQSAGCRRLFDLASARTIRLVLPATSLVEPMETLRRRHRDRAGLQQPIAKELRQLGRTEMYSDRAESYADELMAFLVESQRDEAARLDSVLDELPDVATVLTLDASIVAEARRLGRDVDLKVQDALVLAAVLDHLDSPDTPSAGSLFLNRDRPDFSTPQIRDMLKARQCELVPSFDGGMARLVARLGL